jgi:hypothetical protein
VEDVIGMFNVATTFNRDIGSWNSSNVKDMSYMFGIDPFFNMPILAVGLLSM